MYMRMCMYIYIYICLQPPVTILTKSHENPNKPDLEPRPKSRTFLGFLHITSLYKLLKER